MAKSNRQKGVVLIISLIMLLLLTLIAASSMQTTSLEEKMAGNIRDENLAFQAAETALRAGEAIVTLNSPSFSVAGNGTLGTGLYTTVGVSPPDPCFWATVDWGSNTAVATLPSNTLNYVNKQPRYIIEELPSIHNRHALLPEGVWKPECPSAVKPTWYRITARGTGASDNAVVKLQSIFRR